MIETFLTLYLIIGCALSLIIWWTVFQPDYDDFCRDHLEEEPPTTNEKIVTIIVTPFIWPLTLLRLA